MIEVVCPTCGETVWVPRSMVGGITTCEGCGALVEVPGTSDRWVYYGLVAGGVLLASGIAAGLWALSGSGLAAAIVLAVGLTIVALVAIVS